jgi:GNAT superfamily N-acetyltransferase
MIIRDATVSDIGVIHQLAHEIWWPAYKNIISDEQIVFMLDRIYSEAALKQQMDEGVNFLIAEYDDKPSGFAAYSLTEPFEMIFKLHKLYILPSEQGKGTGRELLDRVGELARKQLGTILELNVNRSNPALGFYKKSGFEIWKTVDIPYYQFFLNDYVMRKKL